MNRVLQTDEMFRQSFGEVGTNTSAYALMYVRDDAALPMTAWNSGQSVPLWARQRVTVSTLFFV